MNYREPLTKNEIREHAAHYENSNPAVYCGTYAKYNNGSLYGMWIDLSTFENYHDFMACRGMDDEEEGMRGKWGFTSKKCEKSPKYAIK